MKQSLCITFLFVILSVGNSACKSSSSSSSSTTEETVTERSLPTLSVEELQGIGCSDADYPAWETSDYVLPFLVGRTYPVRLSNCSSSYHAQGTNDELAFDFVMDVGTLVTASRAGTVIFVEEGGTRSELNNVVVIDHGDDSYAEYMHLMLDGALVEVGDSVEQGDEIGLSGVTGLAGYPHLHFIVVEREWRWPYVGVPVTFRNTAPNPHSLASYTEYTALDYP